MRLMHPLSELCSILIWTGPLLVCCGCSLLDPTWGEPKLPHIEERWTGRIEPLTLYGGRAESEIYQGAMLRLLDGPRMGGVPPELGGGDAPILTRDRESNFRIIPASELPVGKLVEVRGLMVVFGAMNPDTAASPYGDVRLNRKRYYKESHREHIIVVRRPMKVLEE